MKVVDNNVLVVPPFDCAWLSGEELQFPEAGRGCVAFEARADNDVTVVFKEHAGCKHYRTDSDPNYVVIIGSNLNRRLKIEVNGRTVVDVAGPVMPLVFERYWISVDDGLIAVGKGDPGRGMMYRWVDTEPNCKVQFVGLSSWDKHVAYRNIKVLPPVQCAFSTNSATDQQWTSGLVNYLESADLSDFVFILGAEGRRVPAHRVLLVGASSSGIETSPFTGNEILLPSVDYEVLHAVLQYIYTGKAEIEQKFLTQLQDLAEVFGIQTLASQCEQLRNRDRSDVKTQKSLELVFHSGPDDLPVDSPFFSSRVPVDATILTHLLTTGDFSDLELFLEDHNLSLQLHRLVLSVWSAPFAKMFTNGMKESNKIQVVVKDVDLDAFMAMIRFMYSGHLQLEEKDNAGSLMLPLLILADRFGIHLLQQECHDHLLQCVNEDSACAILQVASSMPACESLRNSCEECCAKHFDYCVAAPATEFKELDVQSVLRILQHPDLLVTSEEKVLNAVFVWGAKMDGVYGWEDANKRLKAGFEVVLEGRKEDLKNLLSLVRFPLMPMALLQQLDLSLLCGRMPVIKELVTEAMHDLIQDSIFSDDQKDLRQISNQGRLVSLPKSSPRFTRRLSSFKELLYLCDGDCNGVLYYAGTSYGVHPWMNPMLIKQVTVSASSPASRYTDPKVLVSCNYQATSFAGPCIEAGRTVSWWKVDLGPEHELMCNYYSVRQDGSTNFARTWIFQGSADGDSWTDLRKHVDDHTICRPGQYASWPVHGAKSLIPFRYFRVLLKQPTACGSSPWNLSICYLELYGYLH